MTRGRVALLALLACLTPPQVVVAQAPAAATLAWLSLPPLPAARSGHATVVLGDSLVVLGGTDFPVSLFEGGTKTWYADVFVRRPGGEWLPAPADARLPRPLGYAAAIAADNRILIAGGSDAVQHHADVFALARDADGRWTRASLPPLPAPRAMAGSALLGRTWYVIGGQGAPNDTSAAADLFALDLDRVPAGWQTLTPLPAAGRILPVVVAQAGALVVASGASLGPGPDGAAVRTYLTDTWRYDPAADAWQPRAAVPHAVVAAPALAWGQSHVLVFGGDDGSLAARSRELGERHPGFVRDLLAYHTVTDTWTSLGSLPAAPVTTMAVADGDGIVIAGGEDRPGHRTSAVWRAVVQSGARTFFTLDYVVLAAYLLPLLWIGHRFSRDNVTRDDYFLGGRRVPWWAAGLSIYGTQLSAITFLAIPAKAYAEDWTYLPGNLSIVFVAPVVVAFYLPFFRGLQVTTAYEYLERRFNLATRLLGSAAFVLLQWARMAIVMYLPALALAAVTGIDVYLSILGMGVLCTIYTLQGGMRAVIWADVVQVGVLLTAALVSLLVIVAKIDGGAASVVTMGLEAGKFRMADWRFDLTVASVWVVVFGNLVSHLVPYTADQAVVQRYLTTRDEAQAARAVWTGAVLAVPTSLLFFAVGTALYAFYRTHPAMVSPTVPTDATFAWFIAQQLPMGVSGLVVSGIFAAAMSTLSSSINSITTAIVTDVSVRLRPQASEAAHMTLARRLTVVVGVGGTMSALVLATWDVRSLWDAFLQALGLFGGGLAGLFVLGIFTRRATGPGACVGFVVSGLTLAVVQQQTSLHFLLYAALGTTCAVVVGYAASLVLPARRHALAGLTLYDRQPAPPHRSADRP